MSEKDVCLLDNKNIFSFVNIHVRLCLSITTLNPEKEEPFPQYGTELSREQIDMYIYKCYLKFYMRLGYIIKFICKLRSVNELTRSVDALKDVIINYYKHK